MNSILCFGDCNIDIGIPIEEIPVKGGCSFSSEISLSMGGSVLNTATALERLRIRTIIISNLGTDKFGDMLIDFLNSQDMVVDHIRRTEKPTGVVVGLIAPDGEKRWISVRKNAADIHMTQIDKTLLTQSNILYISGVELVEGKESRNLAIELARQIKGKGGMVFLDPNIRVPTWKIDTEVRDTFEQIYPFVDVFLPNEKELEMLGDNSEIQDIAGHIISKGVSSIWLKLGDEGCACYTESSYVKFPANKVKAVDSSGAGDAFNAAVIFGIVSSMTKEAIGIFANQFASYTVTKYGTTQALPSSIEISSMLQKAGLPIS